MHSRASTTHIEFINSISSTSKQIYTDQSIDNFCEVKNSFDNLRDMRSKHRKARWWSCKQRRPRWRRTTVRRKERGSTALLSTNDDQRQEETSTLNFVNRVLFFFNWFFSQNKFAFRQKIVFFLQRTDHKKQWILLCLRKRGNKKFGQLFASLLYQWQNPIFLFLI